MCKTSKTNWQETANISFLGQEPAKPYCMVNGWILNNFNLFSYFSAWRVQKVEVCTWNETEKNVSAGKMKYKKKRVNLRNYYLYYSGWLIFLFDEMHTSETCLVGSEEEVSLKSRHLIPIVYCTYIYSWKNSFPNAWNDADWQILPLQMGTKWKILCKKMYTVYINLVCP